VGFTWFWVLVPGFVQEFTFRALIEFIMDSVEFTSVLAEPMADKGAFFYHFQPREPVVGAEADGLVLCHDAFYPGKAEDDCNAKGE
jgi:hypothetical protein